MDLESPFTEEEVKVASNDLSRPSVLLALTLQRHGFSHVSVLDGGFPALVEHLQKFRGSVEPLIVNHESDKWTAFLKSTGRENSSANSGGAVGGTARRLKTDAAIDKGDLPRRIGDLSQREKYEIALKMAERLNHPHMKEQLILRLAANVT